MKRYLCLPALVLFLVPALVWAGASAPTVVRGTADIQRDGADVTITASDRAIINWRRFDVPAGSTVRFVQPSANAAVLNRVTGAGASHIDGSLFANGYVYLINPSGVNIGPGATIQANGFVASTLDLRDSDFIAGGELNFFGDSDAAVVNQGRIEAIGGDVYLIAARVSNSGTISAPGGKVGLAAGRDVLLTQDGDLFVRPDNGEEIDGTGVDNTGTIEAVAAELEAHGNMYALAVNNGGAIRASATTSNDGRVVLRADGGVVTQTGELAARNGADGGEIEIAGDMVVLSEDSRIDASGEAGGSVILWGDTALFAAGEITTRGAGRNGGFIETSGGYVSNAASLDPGRGGQWLLDPVDVLITLDSDNVAWGGPGGTTVRPDAPPADEPAEVNATLINFLLDGGADVTVLTESLNPEAPVQQGNITVAAPITKTEGDEATLTLDADWNIIINEDILGVGGQPLNINLFAANNVQINNNLNSNGGLVDILAAGGNIAATAGTTITSDRLRMEALSGIGSSGAATPIGTSVSVLEAYTKVGGIYVRNTGRWLTIGPAVPGSDMGVESEFGGNVELINDSGITISGGEHGAYAYGDALIKAEGYNEVYGETGSTDLYGWPVRMGAVIAGGTARIEAGYNIDLGDCDGYFAVIGGDGVEITTFDGDVTLTNPIIIAGFDGPKLDQNLDPLPDSPSWDDIAAHLPVPGESFNTAADIQVQAGEDGYGSLYIRHGQGDIWGGEPPHHMLDDLNGLISASRNASFTGDSVYVEYGCDANGFLPGLTGSDTSFTARSGKVVLEGLAWMAGLDPAGVAAHLNDTFPSWEGEGPAPEPCDPFWPAFPLPATVHNPDAEIRVTASQDIAAGSTDPETVGGIYAASGPVTFEAGRDASLFQTVAVGGQGAFVTAGRNATVDQSALLAGVDVAAAVSPLLEAACGEGDLLYVAGWDTLFPLADDGVFVPDAPIAIDAGENVTIGSSNVSGLPLPIPLSVVLGTNGTIDVTAGQNLEYGLGGTVISLSGGTTTLTGLERAQFEQVAAVAGLDAWATLDAIGPLLMAEFGGRRRVVELRTLNGDGPDSPVGDLDLGLIVNPDADIIVNGDFVNMGHGEGCGFGGVYIASGLVDVNAGTDATLNNFIAVGGQGIDIFSGQDTFVGPSVLLGGLSVPAAVPPLIEYFADGGYPGVEMVGALFPLYETGVAIPDAPIIIGAGRDTYIGYGYQSCVPFLPVNGLAGTNGPMDFFAGNNLYLGGGFVNGLPNGEYPNGVALTQEYDRSIYDGPIYNECGQMWIGLAGGPVSLVAGNDVNIDTVELLVGLDAWATLDHVVPVLMNGDGGPDLCNLLPIPDNLYDPTAGITGLAGNDFNITSGECFPTIIGALGGPIDIDAGNDFYMDGPSAPVSELESMLGFAWPTSDMLPTELANVADLEEVPMQVLFTFGGFAPTPNVLSIDAVSGGDATLGGLLMNVGGPVLVYTMPDPDTILGTIFVEEPAPILTYWPGGEIPEMTEWCEMSFEDWEPILWPPLGGDLLVGDAVTPADGGPHNYALGTDIRLNYFSPEPTPALTGQLQIDWDRADRTERNAVLLNNLLFSGLLAGAPTGLPEAGAYNLEELLDVLNGYFGTHAAQARRRGYFVP